MSDLSTKLKSAFDAKANVADLESKADITQLADAYDSGTSYAVGDLCTHDNELWKCITATTGDWDSSCWNLTTIGKENLAFSLNCTASQTTIAQSFDASKTYAVGDVVWHNNALYKCTTATTGGEWSGDTNWTEVTTKLAESMLKAEAIYDDYILTETLL